MSTKTRPAAMPGVPGRGRAIAELRRSGAAGIHGRRTPRGRAKRAAIAESREGR